MGIFDRWRAKPAPVAPKRATGADTPMPRLAGGRISTDGWKDGWYSNAYSWVEPDDFDQDWQVLELDRETLAKVDVPTLLTMLASVSPDISRAIWDFLRMSNPGWEYKAYVSDPEGEPDATGQAALDAFFDALRERYKAVDVIFDRIFMGAYLRGAFCAELVLSRDGRRPLDIATPDPVSIRFKRVKDATLGTVYVPGQWQPGIQKGDASGYVTLDRPTFAYVPVDPLPGSPYGRSPAQPALFTSLFLIGMLHDLRRVIAQQGYPRIDISINLEALANAMPAELDGDPEAFQKWVNDIVDEVKTVYTNLEPEDAYVHTSTIEINRPVGTVDANSLGAIDGIIKALERMSIRALKTMPLLMSADNGTMSDAASTREWEVYAQAISAVQHKAENLLEYLLKLALRAQGIQANVRFRFAKLRSSEELRDEQTLALKLANAAAAYTAGFVSQDEASMMAVGHEADEQEPRMTTADKVAMEKANDTMGKGDNDPSPHNPSASKDDTPR